MRKSSKDSFDWKDISKVGYVKGKKWFNDEPKKVPFYLNPSILGAKPKVFFFVLFFFLLFLAGDALHIYSLIHNVNEGFVYFFGILLALLICVMGFTVVGLGSSNRNGTEGSNSNEDVDMATLMYDPEYILHPLSIYNDDEDIDHSNHDEN